MRIIGTVKMRNEEHILKDTLDIWAEYVDGVYVYDDCSEDNSVEIAKAHPIVIDVIATGHYDPDRLKAEWWNRQELLKFAQSRHPEWIAYFDADEHLYEFDKSMFDDKKVHIIATQWHDMYITPEDADLPMDRYKERRWCGVEYRQIPFFYRNSPELKYDKPDQRIMHHKRVPFYPVNGVIQHWGKGHSQMIWDRKCEYYGNGQDYQGKKGIYADKWLARKGEAVHEDYKSDDGNPLLLWSEIRARYQPSVRDKATRSQGKVNIPPTERPQEKPDWAGDYGAFGKRPDELKAEMVEIPEVTEETPQVKMKGGIDISKYDEENRRAAEKKYKPTDWPVVRNGVVTGITEGNGQHKAPIVCCIPRLNPDPRHLADWELFYAENKDKHNLRPYIGYNRALHHVQREAVQKAMDIGASHILFTESDQYRYPLDGLDVLLEADKDVIGFRTYERKYPYRNMCYRKTKPDVSMIIPSEEMKAQEAYLIPFGQHAVGEGGGDTVQTCDLITWAFTLVKTSVFEKMEKAWGNVLVSQRDLLALSGRYRIGTFTKDALMEAKERVASDEPLGLQPFRQWGPHPTDSFFCQYCEDLGIERHVHFGATIAHGDVLPDDILMARRLHESKKMSPYNPHAVSMPLEDDYGNVYAPDFTHLPEVARQDIETDKHAYGGDGTPGPVNKSEVGMRQSAQVLQAEEG